jgi:hypothetical protein
LIVVGLRRKKTKEATTATTAASVASADGAAELSESDDSDSGGDGGDDGEGLSKKAKQDREKARIASLPMFGPFDREVPGTETTIDFEPLRTPGVHLPEGFVGGSPMSLFMLYFTTEFMTEVMELTNKKGELERTKVILSTNHDSSLHLVT